jgi:hypothetical protein
MGLVVALARLIEVEVGKARPQDEAAPAALLVQRPPRPSAPVRSRKIHRAAPIERARHEAIPGAPVVAGAAAAVAPEGKGEPEGLEWPRGPIYIVKKGETFGTIAQKVVGTSKLARKLFEANASRVAKPEALKAGMRLVVPSREALEHD